MPTHKPTRGTRRRGSARVKRHALVVLLALSAAFTVAAPAQASSLQESIFQDDRLLLTQGDARLPVLDELSGLGVNTVHSLVFWHKLAPSPASKRKPKVDLSDPRSYPGSAWDDYDGLVRGAQARGIGVLLSPTGFTPRWAAGCSQRNCRPNSKLYGQFVKAVGKRYSGAYRDENQGGGLLPKVSRWSFWNEPDQKGWIYPQFSRGLPVSARTYRDLVYAGIRSLGSTGHSRDGIYLGETSPIGKRGTHAAPAEFYRALFCIDARGRRLRGAAAATLGCTHFKRLAVNGITHHPYNRGAGGPALRRPPGRDDITLSTLSRLTEVLSQGSRARAIRSGLPVFFTEYGVETNPPDHRFGVRPDAQAQFINQADYTAFKNRRVKGVSQYELFDDPNPGIFNTGLHFTNGSPKPSLDAYRLPIWVYNTGGGVSVWGQVRPAKGRSQTVQIQNSSGGGFQTVATKTVGGRGFFTAKVPNKAGRWRLAWTPSGGGATKFSRSASVGKR